MALFNISDQHHFFFFEHRSNKASKRGTAWQSTKDLNKQCAWLKCL